MSGGCCRAAFSQNFEKHDIEQIDNDHETIQYEPLERRDAKNDDRLDESLFRRHER